MRSSKSQRNYPLTPSRKPLGKAIARGSMKVVADQCLTHELSHKYALKRIGKMVLQEMKKWYLFQIYLAVTQ